MVHIYFSYGKSIGVYCGIQAEVVLHTSCTNPTPCSNEANTTEPYFLTSGTGRIFIVTSVITPRVPAVRQHGGSLKHTMLPSELRINGECLDQH